jgi:ribosome-associated protein
MLFVTKNISVPLRELNFTYSRSSGPGGQHVNKVSTKAIMRWDVTGTDALPPAVKARFMEKYGRRLVGDGELIITSQRFRDRGRNVADCLNKLRVMILNVSTAPKQRRPTKPTAGSRRRNRQAKEAKSKQKKLRRPPRLDD